MFAARSTGRGVWRHMRGLSSARRSTAPTHEPRSTRLKSMVKICGAGIALAALAVPFASAHAATGVPFTNSQVDKVYGSGSDTTYALMNDLATAYNESDGCLLTAVAFPLTAASP